MPTASKKLPPETWDPKASEKEWYSDARTGDRGWKVLRKGIWYIRLDRPAQKIERPFHESAWKLDIERRPLTRHATTQICFEADKILCRSLGLHDKANRDWLSLTQDDRMMWMEVGPTSPDERAGLYKVIKEYLAPLSK